MVFRSGALLATTLFYKDIVSSIVPLQTSMPLTITQINLDGSQSRITQDWVLSRAHPETITPPPSTMRKAGWARA
jgi:hypothetical protein